MVIYSWCVFRIKLFDQAMHMRVRAPAHMHLRMRTLTLERTQRGGEALEKEPN